MRWLKAAGGLLAIVLLFTSCIKVDGKIKIEDDGSGNVDFLTALNTEVLTSVLGDFDIPEAELGGSEELCSGFEDEFGDTSDAPAGATVTPYEEDGFCGSRITYPLAASLDHSADISDLFDDTARLYKEGDNWFFETNFDASDITSEADGAPQAMMDALFGESSFRISVDLPGRAIDGENNATSVGSDGVFTWDIDILNPPARLFAQTEPGSGGGTGGGGLNPLLIIGIVALLAALGAGLFWFMKQKNAGDVAAPPVGYDPANPAMADPLAAPVTGAAGAMPLMDGPPIAAAPPGAAAAHPGANASPIVPEADATKETVIMSSQDILGSADPAVAATSAAAAAASTEPIYDEALGAWVVNDPTRGLLRHDPATDTWNPA